MQSSRHSERRILLLEQRVHAPVDVKQVVGAALELARLFTLGPAARFVAQLVL